MLDLAIALIGFAVSLYIAAEAAITLWLTYRIGPDHARSRLAGAVLSGMSFFLVAALLKALQIADVQGLGKFAAIFALRTFLKFVLQWERRVTGR